MTNKNFNFNELKKKLSTIQDNLDRKIINLEELGGKRCRKEAWKIILKKILYHFNDLQQNYE